MKFGYFRSDFLICLVKMENFDIFLMTVGEKNTCTGTVEKKKYTGTMQNVKKLRRVTHFL